MLSSDPHDMEIVSVLCFVEGKKVLSSSLGENKFTRTLKNYYYFWNKKSSFVFRFLKLERVVSNIAVKHHRNSNVYFKTDDEYCFPLRLCSCIIMHHFLCRPDCHLLHTLQSVASFQVSSPFSKNWFMSIFCTQNGCQQLN